MDLADLFKKQQQDLESFKILRDRAWAEMKERHHNLATAHGGVDSLPENYVSQIQNDITNYHKEWAAEIGTRYKDIITQHEKQRQAITGRKTDVKSQSVAQAQNDNISDKQERLANLIKKQKAIEAKKMRNKPRH